MTLTSVICSIVTGDCLDNLVSTLNEWRNSGNTVSRRYYIEFTIRMYNYNYVITKFKFVWKT